MSLREENLFLKIKKELASDIIETKQRALEKLVDLISENLEYIRYFEDFTNNNRSNWMIPPLIKKMRELLANLSDRHELLQGILDELIRFETEEIIEPVINGYVEYLPVKLFYDYKHLMYFEESLVGTLIDLARINKEKTIQLIKNGYKKLKRKNCFFDEIFMEALDNMWMVDVEEI
ncbi:MAG: hypothetical protein ACTSX6_13070 [Candidatus Heimdallarchaeaceae archaeon]